MKRLCKVTFERLLRKKASHIKRQPVIISEWYKVEFYNDAIKPVEYFKFNT